MPLHFKFQGSLNVNFVCVYVGGGGVGAVLVYTCILGSLDKQGGVPQHNTEVQDKLILGLMLL